jgi:hypothetical protein
MSQGMFINVLTASVTMTAHWYPTRRGAADSFIQVYSDVSCHGVLGAEHLYQPVKYCALPGLKASPHGATSAGFPWAQVGSEV